MIVNLCFWVYFVRYFKCFILSMVLRGRCFYVVVCSCFVIWDMLFVIREICFGMFSFFSFISLGVVWFWLFWSGRSGFFICLVVYCN